MTSDSTVTTARSVSLSAASPGSPPPAPPALEPYTHLQPYLEDVSREVIARIEGQAVARALRCGQRLRRRYGDVPPAPPPPIRLSEEDLMTLARGGIIHHGGGEISCATLSDVGQLPGRSWLRIAEAARSLRRARSSLSSEDHPSRGLLAMEAALGERWASAAAVVLMTVSPASCLVATAFSRHYLGKGSDATLRDLLAAVYGDPLLSFDVVDALGPEHPWFAQGLLEWDEAASEEVLERPLRPGVVFISRALARSDQAPDGPGVRILRSAVDIDEVVLHDRHREALAGLDLGLARRSGRSVGILLTGPSGTGKTMLAQALAQRAGRPLVVVDPERFRNRGEEIFSDGNDLVFTNLLRRAAIHDLPVFIDEADDLITEGTAESQILLTALDRTPVTIILATNNPERLDPALDRRMQMRLRFGIPDAQLRERILERELRHQQWPSEHWPSADERRRLARTWPLSGGYWANGVRAAFGRALAAERPPGGEDIHLEMARIASSRDGRAWPVGWRWDMGTAEPNQDLLGPGRQQAIARFAAALAAPATAELGAAMVVYGPDTGLFEASARALAQAMERLLVVYDGDGHGTQPSLAGSASRGPQSQALAPDLPVESHEPLVIAISQQVSSEQAQACLRRWPVQGQIVLRHVIDEAQPDELTLAAARVDWAQLDAQQAQYLWQRWGGVGAAPAAQCLAALQAARQREHLAQLGQLRPLVDLP
ncbi:MAG: AAA family ATPase [Planctomycetota bacterium]|nr:MAG: AAA family ATPase [Planctomycetota bacterium]